MFRRRPEIGATILTEIGRGGQSTVYSATDPEHGDVAVKVFLVASDESLKLFERERDVLSRLKDIDSIVEVFRTGTTDLGEPYLVMQHLKGGSLQDLIDRTGAMPWTQAARYLSVVSKAVHQAHQRGVIHADLKPSNILLDEVGRPLVSDFGISKIVDQDQTVTTRLMLTPNYAAPEIFDDVEESTSTDIYALGATVASLVAGQPPFASTGKSSTLYGVIRRVMDDPPPTLTEFGAPVRLTNVVRRAMAKDPSQRFSTAEEFGAELDACLAGAKDDYPVAEERVLRQKSPEPPPGEHRRPAWRNPMVLAAVLAVVVVAVAGGLWFLTRSEDLRPRTVAVELDGSGDFTTIGAALDEITPGSTIRLGEGFHEVDETLVLEDSISIIGAGQDETRLVGEGNGPTIEAHDISLGLEDLTITYAGSGSNVDVVALTDVDLRLISIAVKSGTGIGLVVDGRSTGVVEDCIFSENDRSGFVQRGTSDLEISDNVARDNLGSGFVWEQDATGEARRNDAEQNMGQGFRIVGSSHPELSNNAASHNRESGFSWTGSAGGTARSNTSTLNSDFGFTVTGEAQPTLIDNTSTENGRSGFGWHDFSGGEGIDNEARSNGLHGFFVASRANPLLTGGIATGNERSGFVWWGAGGGGLRENTAQGNTEDGFAFGHESRVDEIKDNEAIGNAGHGFRWDSPVGEGPVVGNLARENSASGFSLHAAVGADVLTDNRAERNERYGFVGPSLGDLQAVGNTAVDNGLGDWLDTEPPAEPATGEDGS